MSTAHGVGPAQGPSPAPARPLTMTGVTKSFGPVRAVSDLSFTVEPGTVTGFLGPNGAGKTTTLRMVLGLMHPDLGTATFNGAPYTTLTEPLRTVGAVLETAFHPARSGRNHLRVYCRAAGLPLSRANEVLTTRKTCSIWRHGTSMSRIAGWRRACCRRSWRRTRCSRI